MPSQQVEIAEAIAGIKRALKRERERMANYRILSSSEFYCTDCGSLHAAPSDQPAVGASNRGNKLKQGAKYIHEGSLTYASGPEIYREVGNYRSQ